MNKQESLRSYYGKGFDGGGPGTVMVQPDDRELENHNERDDWPNHSPDGFQVGYNGSGPAQLAFALLADVFDTDTAWEHYQQFKKEEIATIEADRFKLTEDYIRDQVSSY